MLWGVGAEARGRGGGGAMREVEVGDGAAAGAGLGDELVGVAYFAQLTSAARRDEGMKG
jgi:hypothetical protein